MNESMSNAAERENSKNFSQTTEKLNDRAAEQVARQAAGHAADEASYAALESMKRNEVSLDAIRGSLVGGAAGDALGYPVEFYSLGEIQSIYGEAGITHYHYGGKGLARISDDTQMTLFTATGLLLATTRGRMKGVLAPDTEYVHSSYYTWYLMQRGHSKFGYEEDEAYPYSWLYRVPEMGENRAPGNTCMSALSSKKCGSIEHPLNHSKGCGGIMRVAPVGLYRNRGLCEAKPETNMRENAGDQERTDDLMMTEQLRTAKQAGVRNPGKDVDRIKDVDWMAAQVAAITHGHPLGYMPAAALAHIVNRVAYWNLTIEQAVEDAMSEMKTLFAGTEELDEMLVLVDIALQLAKNEEPDTVNIRSLGEGWVAEETLAISVYCAVKYADDFSKAIIAAVNHSGDSDSTGAVTGNIVGAALGYEAIPDEWKDRLECLDVILEVADDLCHDCQMSESSPYRDPEWMAKY
ncbi:MAG: ADP-ribosylglycohydrolase family protein [Lachnospiraceae bacterium]|nr:ADP-ribosylglycohydrolase family protein [Lachnospiraceae bacterium]